MINAQRQVMVIVRPLSFRDSESRGGRRQIMVIPHAFSPKRGDHARWHAETNYGHSVPHVNQEEWIRQYRDDVGCRY